VYFEGDRLVTRRLDSGQTQVQPLNDRGGARTIAQLTPPGYPGKDRIKALFQVDQQRLRMTVEDLLTQQTLLQNQVVAQLLRNEKLKLFHFFTFLDLTVLDSIVNSGFLEFSFAQTILLTD